MDKRLVIKRERTLGVGKMDEGGQLYGDRWELHWL